MKRYALLIVLLCSLGCSENKPPRPQIATIIKLVEDDDMPWKVAIWRDYEVIRLGELDIIIRYSSGTATTDENGHCYVNELKVTENSGERLLIADKAKARWESVKTAKLKEIEKQAIKEKMATLRQELKELEDKNMEQ